MKIKKILFLSALSMFLSLTFVLVYSNVINAKILEYCSIGHIKYEYPVQVATKSYSIEFLNGEPEDYLYEFLSDEEVDTIHTISNSTECDNLKLQYKKTITRNENSVSYSLENVVYNIYKNGLWSISETDFFLRYDGLNYPISSITEYKKNLTIYDQYDHIIKLNDMYQVITNNTSSYVFDKYDGYFILKFLDSSKTNISSTIILNGTDYTYDEENDYLIVPYPNEEHFDLVFEVALKKEIEETIYDIVTFYSSNNSSLDIIEKIYATDNVDGYLNNKITIIEDTYENRSSTIGDFYIKLEVKDESNNISYCKINVYVRDGTAPSIYGRDNIIVYISNTKTLKEIIQLNYYMTDYIDYVEDNVTILEENFTENRSIPGTYNVSFKVFDYSGNETFKNITITVKDDIPPMYTIKDSYFVYTDGSSYIDIDTMVYILKRDLFQLDDFSTFEVYEDTYTSSHNEDGNYAVSFKITHSDDTVEFKTLNIVVDSKKENKNSPNYFMYLLIIGLIITTYITTNKIKKAFIV